MTTLVPAQPQEEEEEGEEQEEEEEELNSSMEQEHTQLDEMDISRDMQNEISSAQSLDDAEHAPMTALVPAPVGNEGNHSMMTATLQSQSGAIRSQAKTKKATWQPSQTTQSGIRKAYSKKKKARVQRATRINPASQDLRAAERTHPNASQSSWEHTEDEEARLVQEPRTAEGAPEGRSVAVVGQDGVLTSSNHIGGDQVSTLRDQTQDLESKRMNDQAASMLVDPLCPSTVVDGDVVMDDVQSEMLQDLSSEKFGRSANSGSSEEGARRPQTPQVPCKRKRDSYNRRPKKKHRRLWKKTNSRKFNLLRTSTPAVHGDIGDEATGQAPNEMEHQPAAKTSERISFPGGNTGKAISNNVQHQDPVLEQQEILVGRGSWQATQPSHGADESNSPQPIPAGPRAIQAEDQLADGKETLEGHNRDPERRSSQEREDGQLKPGRPSYERSEEDDSAQPMSADPPAIPSREQFVHDRETLDGQNEDFQSRIIQQRADALAQLQTPSASLDHVSTRPVTEILLDLPSLIKRFREDASQVDDGSVYGANIAVQDHPGQETARSPSVTGTDSEATITPSQRSTRDSDRYTDNAPSLDLSQQAIHRQQSEVRLFEAPPQVGESEDEEMEEAPGEPSPTPDTTPNNPRPLKAINEAPSALSNNRRTRQSVLITFYMWENKQGKWIVSDEVWVSPGNPTEAQRIAERHRGVDFYHFWNDELRRTLLQNCVREAIRDGTLAIFMRSGRSVRVTDPMNAAAVATMRGLSEE
ncbi:hypothetical protein CBS147347_11310 [Aspergillus niger]|nr:hypothetical protein CBS147347_11310 [Aspergillus niger]